MRGTCFMTHKFVCFTMLSVLLIVVMVGQAHAGPSYTTTMAFFQGFDLEEGAVDKGIKKLLEEGTEAPDVIRLVFVVKDLEPEKTEYDFNPSVDFQVGYSAEYDFWGLLPNQLASLAILENQSFDSVLSPNIFTLGLTYDPIDIRFEQDDTIIVWTNNDNFFKLGNFSLSGSTLIFDYAKIEPDIEPVPEPSMIVLFGLGLLGIATVFRKKTILRKKKGLFLLAMILVLTGISNAHALKKSQTGFVYPVNVDYIPLKDGGYVGWLDVNKYHNPPYHLGVDFKITKGLPVYAIADGEIVAITRGYGGTPSPDGAMMIRHQTSDESYFTANYGHITILKTSGRVKAGDHIGNIADFWLNGNPFPHLHFSIHPGTSVVWKGYTSELLNPTRYADVIWNENDAGSWRCRGKSVRTCDNNRAEINVIQACREQRNSSAEAKVTDQNSAFSWTCVVKVPVYSGSFKISSTSGAETQFNVKVTKSGTGSGTVEAKDIACGPDCTGGEYAIGSFVDLKAIPAVNSTFAGWQVNGQPASGAIPVSSNPVMMTATFDKKPETKPVITGVSPNPMPRKFDWSRQWMTIYGRNFQPGAKLLFKIVGTNYVYPDRVPNYISSTELRYYISVGPRVYDWTVEVINPDGNVSNAYGFQVR